MMTKSVNYPRYIMYAAAADGRSWNMHKHVYFIRHYDLSQIDDCASCSVRILYAFCIRAKIRLEYIMSTYDVRRESLDLRLYGNNIHIAAVYSRFARIQFLGSGVQTRLAQGPLENRLMAGG